MKLIAIIDTLANDLLGPIQSFRREEPAIRMFTEVVQMPNYASHLNDLSLVYLGELNEDTLEIETSDEHGGSLKHTIVTAQQIVAALNARKGEDK